MKDILECRIEGVLSEIEATRLCDLPEEEAITVEEFVGATERTCQAAAETLTKYAVFHVRLRVVIPVSCDTVFVILYLLLIFIAYSCACLLACMCVPVCLHVRA